MLVNFSAFFLLWLCFHFFFSLLFVLHDRCMLTCVVCVGGWPGHGGQGHQHSDQHKPWSTGPGDPVTGQCWGTRKEAPDLVTGSGRSLGWELPIFPQQHPPSLQERRSCEEKTGLVITERLRREQPTSAVLLRVTAQVGSSFFGHNFCSDADLRTDEEDGWQDVQPQPWTSHACTSRAAVLPCLQHSARPATVSATSGTAASTTPATTTAERRTSGSQGSIREGERGRSCKEVSTIS